MLLVAGIRAEALDHDGTLSEWVSWLVRDRRARRLELETLAGGDVARLLEASAGDALGGGSDALARFGGWLFEEMGGQPFFMTETLRALSDRGLVAVLPRTGGGWSLDVSAATRNEDEIRSMLPPGVHEVLRVRLSHLSPRASELLSAAAVLGQRFEFEPLLRVAGLGEDEGLTLLDEANAEEDDPTEGYYAFSHNKTWDVAYTEAGSARRRVLHRRALGMLEEGGTPSAELARHALGAGLKAAARGGDSGRRDGPAGRVLGIHAAVGGLRDERGERDEAREAFGRAAETVSKLAEKIGDEGLRRGCLSAPPVRHVLE